MAARKKNQNKNKTELRTQTVTENMEFECWQSVSVKVSKMPKSNKSKNNKKLSQQR